MPNDFIAEHQIVNLVDDDNIYIISLELTTKISMEQQFVGKGKGVRFAHKNRKIDVACLPLLPGCLGTEEVAENNRVLMFQKNRM